MSELAVDFCINGGGMVGASAALGLADAGFDVALIEPNPPALMTADQPFELRVSALAPASIELLTKLNVWDEIATERVCPYRRMRVFDQHTSGDVLFDAADIGAPYLGYIVENRRVQSALWQRICQHEQIQILKDTRPKALSMDHAQAQITLDDGRRCRANWLLAGDGGESWVRRAAGIGEKSADYRVHAQVLSVHTAYPQQDITWQRFTSHGPEAFLPLAGQRGSIVWYDRPASVQRRAGLDHDALLAELHETFPAELGEITRIERSGSFPIRKMHAHTYHHQRVVLLGDAAHTIHPLAGQGANLGFADVTAWLDGIERVAHQKDGWKKARLAGAYERARRLDNQLIQSAMDVFDWGFMQRNPLLRAARAAGMNLVARNRWLRGQLTDLAGGGRFV